MCLYSVLARDFRLRVNLQKTRVHGCAHAIRVILNASTVRASIKFKSSCTVSSYASVKMTASNQPCMATACSKLHNIT